MSKKSNTQVESKVTVDSPIKAGEAVETKAEPKLAPYGAMIAALPASSLVPKTALDNAITFARTVGMPESFSTYRDEILSAVGRLTGKSQWTGTGAKASVKLTLGTAMASVAKHEANASKEAGTAAKVASRDLKRVLAILAAIGGDTEFSLGE